MAYADRAGLKTAVRTWIAELNQDVLPDATIDQAIGFVENDLDFGVWGPFGKQFRVLQMQAVKRTTILNDNEEYVTLPTDFIVMRYVTVATDSAKQTLDYRAPEDFIDTADSLPSSRRVYMISAGQIRVKPVLMQADTVEMGYYQQIPALTTDTATNWLLSDNPQIYLYGTLSHLLADDALGSPQKLANVTTGYQRAVLGMIDADNRRETGEGPLAYGQYQEPA